MLTVFNVYQGDSCLLNPKSRCIFNELPLLIDCGLKKAEVYKKIPYSDISVMLTHSHRDHIGGFPDVLKSKKVHTIYIPYYLPEIIRISKYLTKHIRMTGFGDIDWEKISKNRSVTIRPSAQKKLPLLEPYEIQFVCEGMQLCDHTRILNPPLSPEDHFPEFYGAEEISIENALSQLSDRGIELPRDEILNYRPPEVLINSNGNTEENYAGLARTYVHYFFISLSGRLRNTTEFAMKYEIASHLLLTANQASVVMQYFDAHSNVWLFTGDADQYVFDRLIAKGTSLKSDYLKVPHHGSRENLSRSILKVINPSVAIVSHGNKGFGKSKDAHPHHEVIDLLKAYPKLQTFYTNDVIKKGKVHVPGTSGTVGPWAGLKSQIKFAS